MFTWHWIICLTGGGRIFGRRIVTPIDTILTLKQSRQIFPDNPRPASTRATSRLPADLCLFFCSSRSNTPSLILRSVAKKKSAVVPLSSQTPSTLDPKNLLKPPFPQVSSSNPGNILSEKRKDIDPQRIAHHAVHSTKLS